MHVIRRMTPPAVVALLLESAPPGDSLDSFIGSQMAQRQINALSLATIRDGQIEPRAYGVTARGGAPVTTATLFQAGSISKPVAATGALKLVDRGVLTLDEDVNAKLKSWKVPDNAFTQTEKDILCRLLSPAPSACRPAEWLCLDGIPALFGHSFGHIEHVRN